MGATTVPAFVPNVTTSLWADQPSKTAACAACVAARATGFDLGIIRCAFAIANKSHFRADYSLLTMSVAFSRHG